MTETTSYRRAALAVLQESDRPLTTKEITDEAIRRGWLKPTSKTPVKSMSAVLYRQTKWASPQKIVRLLEPNPGHSRPLSVRWTLPTAD